MAGCQVAEYSPGHSRLCCLARVNDDSIHALHNLISQDIFVNCHTWHIMKTSLLQREVFILEFLRKNLILLFALIQPEMYLEKLRNNTKLENFPNQLTYRHYALEYFRNLNYEEIDNLYSIMCSAIRKREKKCGNSGIFSLLPEYTLHILTTEMNNPVCKQDERLNWRSCYLQLGQDLLTTSHLAYVSITENRTNNYFGWSPIIGTDDRRLSEIINKGLAENHFHLNGSTRSFDLSWICLMNHPSHINKFFTENNSSEIEKTLNEKFKENLSAGISLGTSDNRMSWRNRLIIASWLRVQLFIWLQLEIYPKNSIQGTNDCFDFNDLFNITDRVNYISSGELVKFVDSAKLLFGQAGKILQPNKKSKNIDYAITPDIAINDCNCRSLVGERALMYNAFRLIYSGNVSNHNWNGFAELFYLYILIKTQFRREMIQVNGRYGFKNFAKYQDRKDIIFEEFKEYNLEAKNLSVNDGIKNCHINSVEMRICPQKTAQMQYKKIKSIDNAIMFLQNEKTKLTAKERKEKGLNENYFYVLHFPKIPDAYHPKWDDTFSFLNKPRNDNVRKNSEKQAKAIAKAIEKHNWLCSRIRGFDACAYEISCRPEVFATEFRFLRSFVCPDLNTNKLYDDVALQPKLCATYHVGEDFMDIIDGLRAIDEALIFLEMQPGERLGHTIALGTNILNYYKLKNYCIVLKKQDYLDNIVWALSKSKSLNINLGSAFKQKLYDKANSLIYEIYGANISVTDYFNSWLLRGDDPKLYRFGYFDKLKYNSECSFKANSILAQYSRFRIGKNHHPEELNAIRENKIVAQLYSMYHFNTDTRAKGEECEEIYISDDYITMAENLQIGMQQEVARLRIGIECNLSSNVLIGPFDSYDQHHIFTLYPFSRENKSTEHFVSINTDDQGVFDTSLEEEYYLLECTLRSIKKSTNAQLYSDDIYGYLEQLRRNGFSQIFPKVKK